MGVKYLWDTNTAIYFLQQQFPTNAEKFIDSILLTTDPTFSVISEIELLSWKTPTRKDLNALHRFLSEAAILDLSREIKLQTAEIRKSTNIKLPDAIIASTALVHNLTLLTRNVRDFTSLSNLQIINPHDQ